MLSAFVGAIPEEILEERRTERLTAVSHSTPHRRRPRAYESSSFDDEEPDSGADEWMNQDTPRFVKGERVVHQTFGSGAVLEVSGFGRDLKVTVDFDDVGRKKLLLRYAALEKDWP